MIKKYFITPLKNGTIIFGITFILLEVVLAIYIRVAEIKIELPTYSFENTQSFWFDNNKDFGASHLPNHSYRQKKYCFDVLYTTNSHGFRDKERAVTGENHRVVMIGDSFVEGVGVDTPFRVSDLLEESTTIPHLNYGLAGNFGPVQYYMLYKTVASTYTHDAVLIGILPANDFIDDDLEISQKVSENRYKPFFKGNYPDYELVYHLDSLHKSKALPRKQRFRNKILKNFSYSYNMYRYIQARKRVVSFPKEKMIVKNEIPSYFNYTEKQFNIMKYALEEIKILAGDRPVFVFTIPIFKEIQQYRRERKNPLGKDLKAFCDAQGIAYLDLLPLTDQFSIEECEAQFLSCDGHWSESGNLFAKQQIQSYFEYYK